jgi:hypothetical protein
MSMFDGWMNSADKVQPRQQANNQQPQNPPQNGGNPPNSGTNPNPNLENNPGTNQDLIATIWDETKGADQPGGNPGNQQSQNQQPQNQANGQRTSEQINQEISQHLNSVGLGELAITAEQMQQFQGENGTVELAKFVNTRIQQSYMQAIQSSQKLFTNQLEKILPEMVEQAVGKSKQFFTGENLRASMRTDEFLKPFMDDPAIAPVVETVMRQFIVKGSDRNKAMEQTKQYFKRIRQVMDPEGYIEPNPNTRTTFRGNPRTLGNTSFIDILKGNG